MWSSSTAHDHYEDPQSEEESTQRAAAPISEYYPYGSTTPDQQYEDYPAMASSPAYDHDQGDCPVAAPTTEYDQVYGWFPDEATPILHGYPPHILDNNSDLNGEQGR